MREIHVTDDTLDDIGQMLRSDDWVDFVPYFDVRTGTMEMAELDSDEADQLGSDPDRLPIPMGSVASVGILSQFADSLADQRLAAEVRSAASSKGAFRRVKDLLDRRGKLDLWGEFEHQRDVASARAWLESQGIRVV